MRRSTRRGGRLRRLSEAWTIMPDGITGRDVGGCGWEVSVLRGIPSSQEAGADLAHGCGCLSGTRGQSRRRAAEHPTSDAIVRFVYGTGKSRSVSVSDRTGALRVADLLLGLRGLFGMDRLAEPVCQRDEMQHCAGGEGERESLSRFQI
jgi:hypothetical protein